MTQRRKIFIISCFTAAFAAVAAGFGLKGQIYARTESEKDETLARLAAADCAEYVEKLCFVSELLTSTDKSQKGYVLSEISLHSSLASNTLGHIESYTGIGKESLLSFLSGLSELAKKASVSENSEDTSADIQFLISYAKKLSESDIFMLFSESREEFDKKLYKIFGGTELETLFCENGIKTSPKRGFESIRAGKASEKDILAVAGKHLGVKAHLEISPAGADIPVYTLCGRNTYAAVSHNGEKILSLLLDTDKGKKRIDESEAFERARSFLESEKINTNDAETEGKYESGVYLFRFTPISNGIVCLNETITVGITHGSGRICIFDAVGYYRYHSPMSDTMQVNAKITAEEAMTICGGENAVLCKISPKTGTEMLCYRIIRAENSHPIFINAMSGRIISYETVSYNQNTGR